MGSILDDIDVQLESNDAIKYIIRQFIKDNYEFYTLNEMFNIHIVLKTLLQYLMSQTKTANMKCHRFIMSML